MKIDITATNGIKAVVHFDVGGHVRVLSDGNLEFIYKGDFEINFDNVEIKTCHFDPTYKFLTLTAAIGSDTNIIDLKLDNGFYYDFIKNDRRHAKSQFELLQMFNMTKLQFSTLQTRLDQYLFQVRIEKFMTKMENRIGK